MSTFDLVNVETNEREIIHDPNRLQEAILAGSHAFPKGQWVKAFDNYGDYTEVLSDDVHDAIQQGFRVATPTQATVQDYVLQNKGLGSAAKVALAQFGDEAFFGLPEMFMEGTADPLEMAKWDALKKEHELANAIGGVGGFGASLFIGGPLFKGAATAGRSVARMGAKAGFKVRNKLTESLAAKLQASTKMSSREAMKHARGLTRVIMPVKTGAKGVGAAVEGGIASLPFAGAEIALGDPETAAEHVLAGVGIGSLFGVGGHLSGKFFKGAAKVTGAKKALDQIRESLNTEKGLKSLAGSKAIQGTGINTSQAEKLRLVKEFAEENGEWTIKPINELSDADLLNTLAAETLIDEGIMTGLTSKKEMEKRLQAKIADYGPKVGEKRREIDSKYREAVMVAPQDIADGVRKNVLAPMKANKAIQPSEIKRLEKMLKRLEATDEATFQQGLEAEREIIGKALDDTLEAGYEIQKKAGIKDPSDRVYGRVRRSLREAQKAKEKIKSYGFQTKPSDFDDDLKYLLEDKLSTSVVPGYQNMSTKQIRKAIDDKVAAYEKALPFAEELSAQEKMLASELNELNRMEFSDNLQRMWSLEDAAQQKSYYQGRIKQIGKVNDQQVPDFYREIAKEINRQTRQKVREAGGDDKLLELMKLEEKYGNLKAFEHIIAKSAAKETSLNDLGLNSFISGGIGTGIGTALGGGLGGILGAAAGMGVREFARRYGDQIAAVAANSQAAALAAEGVIKAGAVKQYGRIPQIIQGLKSAKNRVWSTGPAVTGLMAVMREDSDSKDRARLRYMEKLNEKIGKLAASPTIMSDTVATLSDPLLEGGAPEVGEAMHYKAIDALEYISQNIPRPPAPNNPFAPQVEWIPSDYELAAFERKLEVVQNPFVVLDELEQWTLTKDHMEALDAVYPQIAMTIRNKVQEEAMKGVEPVPYEARAKLSLLMGAPMDDTFKSQSVAYFQQSFMDVEEQDQGVKAQVNVAQNHMTPTQRLLT